MIYYAHFIHKDGFRVYKIIADSEEDAKRIALSYDSGNTRVGDKFELWLAGEKIVNEVIE